MLRMLLTVAFAMWSPTVFAASYWTSCVLEEGKARGYVHTTGSMSFSGSVRIDQFDEDNDRVESDRMIVVVVVAGANTKFVDEVDADDDATFCTLDISDAVGSDPDGPNGPADPRYRTSCEIVGGSAMGYIHTNQSLNLSGSVYFKIYDADWDLIDEERELVVVIVVGSNTKLVDEIDVDDDARYCLLDVSEAVEE